MKAPTDEIYDKSMQRTWGYNYVAVFIRLAVVASEICETPRNFTKIRIYICYMLSRAKNATYVDYITLSNCRFISLTSSVMYVLLARGPSAVAESIVHCHLIYQQEVRATARKPR